MTMQGFGKLKNEDIILSFVVTFIYASECKIRSTGEEYKYM